MKNISIIMAHKQAQETVERHLPFWEKENPNILFTCPQDSMMSLPNYNIVEIGKAAHHSSEAIRRFKSILRFMTTIRSDWYTLHEYDSIIFGPVESLPSEAGVLYCNQNPEHKPPENWDPDNHPEGWNHRGYDGFKGFHFPHPPLRMDYDTLCKLSEAFDKEPDYCERGFWDRAVGYVCEKNKIKMIGWGELGCSHNTIHPGEGWPRCKWAVQRKKEGAICYHGIKDKEVLEALISA
jgi:hypothetical protein